MVHDERITQELFALLGVTVMEYIREGEPFEIHELAQALQKRKDEAPCEAMKEQCERLIRLLSELMH
ncbi:hypothetical protein [Candidatus Pantoea multigeneris]|uniref:Uncharacterized protein n=1 Tax=Candidatus Pantoea multigeneris TaxID=2608357 RepID=A0ABX0RF07_9GAMM|nr:hypothetical protein [Pantoea multigeneris]NIF23945.1 hypothetical protein [Pantoea multigeneris]